jgi:hypothetical protein
MRLRNGFLFGLVLSISTLNASEIDSFTDRDPLMKDSSREVNRIINRYFAEALAIANQAHYCDQNILNKALTNKFYGFLWTAIENEITSSRVDKRQSLVRESVYQDFSAWESPTFQIAEIGALLRLGDFFIGTDKLGHFVQVGYDMFTKIYSEGKTTQEVIDWSSWTEQTYYGIWTTGIYSYGDLASNLDGLYFWERIAGRTLPIGVEPYFTCENGAWRQNSAFDIGDYVNAAWDEGINCNRYDTRQMAQKVHNRIAALEAKTGLKLQCPIAPEQCRVMIERYGPAAPFVIHPICFE